LALRAENGIEVAFIEDGCHLTISTEWFNGVQREIELHKEMGKWEIELEGPGQSILFGVLFSASKRQPRSS
jgi:hypothetical protein